MTDHDYIEVFRLWNAVTPPELSDVDIPASLAEAWLIEYGYEFLKAHLGRILINWVRTRTGNGQDPADDLIYLRNYISAGLRNERAYGLKRKSEVRNASAR